MPKELLFHPSVANDISTAFAWYEERSVGLGERFRTVVDSRFNDITNTPERFPLAFDKLDYRFANIPKVSYLALFEG